MSGLINNPKNLQTHDKNRKKRNIKQMADQKHQ